MDTGHGIRYTGRAEDVPDLPKLSVASPKSWWELRLDMV